MKKIMTFKNLDIYEINETNVIVMKENETIKTFNNNKCDLLDTLFYIESINDNDDTLYIDNDYNFIINTITEENIDINYKLKDL